MSHFLWSNEEKPTINILNVWFAAHTPIGDDIFTEPLVDCWMVKMVFKIAAMRHFFPNFTQCSPIFGGIHVNMFRVWYVKTHFWLEAGDETPEYGRFFFFKVATSWKAIGFGGMVCDIGLSPLPPAMDILAMWGGHQKWCVPSWVEFPLYMITYDYHFWKRFCYATFLISSPEQY